MSTQKISDIAADISFETKARIQAAALSPMLKLYAGCNIALMGGIAIFAVGEHFHPAASGQLITPAVVIALITGITAQVGAVIIAAFKGLFGSADDQPTVDKSTKAEPLPTEEI